MKLIRSSGAGELEGKLERDLNLSCCEKAVDVSALGHVTHVRNLKLSKCAD